MHIELDFDQKAELFKEILLEELAFYHENLKIISLLEFSKMDELDRQNTLDDLEVHTLLNMLTKYYI